MIRTLLIAIICNLHFSNSWSQAVVEKDRSEESNEIRPQNNASAGNQMLADNKPLALQDVLFATNEDCELFINEESKGIVSKNQHKYIKLAPGNYVYKAKNRAIQEELKESFSVRESGLNEIFIDLLYFIDEKKQQRQNLNKTQTAGQQVAVTGKTSAPVKQELKPETNTAVNKGSIQSLLSNMIAIKGGSFIMGNNKAPSEDEAEHPVTVNPIRISKYEVTQQQWQEVMGYNPSLNKGCNTCPVENVSWEEVMKFIRKLNVTNNKKFRLPTEAEWEYVAKLGGKAEIESEGGPEEYIKKTAWYFGNSDKKTHPVGQKQPNAAGVYDLLGNVAEWCYDWYSSNYYKEDNNQKNPEGPPLGKEKVIRGGSFNDYTGDRFRPSLRNKLKPTSKSGDIGFRLVLEGD